MNCKNCNTALTDDQAFCPNCGTMVNAAPSSAIGCRCLPAFILGLIGSIFGILGGLCTTMCYSLFSSGFAPFILIFGGSIVGLVGACGCLKNALRGSILQFVAALAIIICAYGISGSDFLSVIALLLFLAGGAIGLIKALTAKKK